MENKELVLLFGIEQSMQDAMLAALAEMEIPVRVITNIEALQTIGYLAGLEHFDKKELSADQEQAVGEIMLLKDVSDARIQEFNQRMQKLQVWYSGPKAVLTKYNIHWTLLALLTEVHKDHALFMKYQAIILIWQQLRKDADKEKAKKLDTWLKRWKKQEMSIELLEAMADSLRAWQS